MGNPLEQFKINTIFEMPKLLGMNIDFTNSSLFMTISVCLIVFFVFGGIRKREVIPGYWQAMVEGCYNFIKGTIINSAGKEGMKYFSFIFTLFLFVLFCNVLGMIPTGFTVTSHIAITFLLAIVVFIYMNIIAFSKHGIKYCKMFLPKGTPWWLAPLMIFIELFAYLSRPISLSVRLAANMMAGHTMLKIIAGFVLKMHIILALFPFLFVVVLTGFEIFVALLQAYIFTILTCIYLNDALHMH